MGVAGVCGGSQEGADSTAFSEFVYYVTVIFPARLSDPRSGHAEKCRGSSTLRNAEPPRLSLMRRYICPTRRNGHLRPIYVNLLRFFQEESGPYAVNQVVEEVEIPFAFHRGVSGVQIYAPDFLRKRSRNLRSRCTGWRRCAPVWTPNTQRVSRLGPRRPRRAMIPAACQN